MIEKIVNSRPHLGADPERSLKTHRTAGFGLAEPFNLLLILGLLLLHWQVHSANIEGRIAVEPGHLLYYLFQALFLWLAPRPVIKVFGTTPALRRLLYTAFYGTLLLALSLNLLVMVVLQTHTDAVLLYLVLEPGAIPDTGVSLRDLALAVVAIALVFTLQWFLLQLEKAAGWIRAVSNFFGNPKIASIALTVFALSWVSWSFADYKDAKAMAHSTGGIPFYLPRNLELGDAYLWSALGFKPDRAPASLEKIRASTDHTPESELYSRFYRELRATDFEAGLTAEKDWDILVIASESWRSDMLDPEIMPRLWALAQRRGWISPAHYSTGNSTAEGLFGLFAGQAPFYWHVSFEEGLTPLFFPILKQLGYQTGLISSSTFDYRQVRENVFGQDIDSYIMLDQMKSYGNLLDISARPLEKEDQALVDRYLQMIEERGPGKYFDFLFFYVTHWNYYYPPEFEKFTPVLDSDFSLFNLFLQRRADELRNRYKNASHYLDHLLATLLQRLEETGRLDKTLVVITGDHGEEFMEQGRYTHSMSLNNYQTQVPLLLLFPDRPEIEYSVTSHADIVPTLLAQLGLSRPMDALFTGKNLTEYRASENAATVVSLMRKELPLRYSLVRDDHKIVFQNLPEGVRLLDHYGLDDTPLPPPSQERRESTLRYLESVTRHFDKPLPGSLAADTEAVDR